MIPFRECLRKKKTENLCIAFKTFKITLNPPTKTFNIIIRALIHMHFASLSIGSHKALLIVYVSTRICVSLSFAGTNTTKFTISTHGCNSLNLLCVRITKYFH